LPASPQEPLRFDPARSRDAGHGWFPGNGGPEGNRNRRLPAGAGRYRPSGSQVARASVRREGFHAPKVQRNDACPWLGEEVQEMLRLGDRELNPAAQYLSERNLAATLRGKQRFRAKPLPCGWRELQNVT